MNIRSLLKDFLPPMLLRFIRKEIICQYEWSGNYTTWAEAKNKSSGYDNNIILEKAKESLLKVKNGDAIYERDSVLFDKMQYSYPLLAALMWIAANNKGVLNIIDFGGSLGSSYFQNRLFLNTLDDVRWNIVEQKRFVEDGKKYFENERIRFYYNVEDCLKEESPNAILFSSVIQYLEKPYDLLCDVVNKRFEYIIFDRTSFNCYCKDRLVVQKVSPKIYNVSYPCWFLDINRFKKIFEDGYDLISEFDSFDKRNDSKSPMLKGFIYKLKGHLPNA